MVMVDVETAARYYEYLEMEKADSSPASSKASSISRKNDEGHCNCQTSSGLYHQKRPVDDHNTNVLSATTKTASIEDATARRPIDENYWPLSSSTTSQTYM